MQIVQVMDSDEAMRDGCGCLVAGALLVGVMVLFGWIAAHPVLLVLVFALLVGFGIWFVLRESPVPTSERVATAPAPAPIPVVTIDTLVTLTGRFAPWEYEEHLAELPTPLFRLDEPLRVRGHGMTLTVKGLVLGPQVAGGPDHAGLRALMGQALEVEGVLRMTRGGRGPGLDLHAIRLRPD